MDEGAENCLLAKEKGGNEVAKRTDNSISCAILCFMCLLCMLVCNLSMNSLISVMYA